MNARTLVFMVAIILAVPISFAEDKIEIEDTYGTWVNSDYNEKGQDAKVVINPDGTVVSYAKETDKEPKWTGQFTITDSWHDNEGNLWINREGIAVKTEQMSQYIYLLYKFSNDGTVCELVWSGADYPTEMSPIGGNYEIHYRQ